MKMGEVSLLWRTAKVKRICGQWCSGESHFPGPRGSDGPQAPPTPTPHSEIDLLVTAISGIKKSQMARAQTTGHQPSIIIGATDSHHPAPSGLATSGRCCHPKAFRHGECQEDHSTLQSVGAKRRFHNRIWVWSLD